MYELRGSCLGNGRCKLIACLFGGLTGESSSSSLPVRSMTGAGRLLLDHVEDCSREVAGVCRHKSSEGRFSCFTGVSPGSLISTNSSSSVAGVKVPGPVVTASSLGVDHCPLGSIITCSTSSGVERSISSTYLEGENSVNTKKGRWELTGRHLGTHSLLPLRKPDKTMLVLVLAVGETTMRQSTDYACITQSDMAPLFVESRADTLATSRSM